MRRSNSGELTKNVVLWRYLDLSKFIRLLQTSSLFFLRVDKFEDKFEGSFTASVKKLIERSYEENDIDFTYEQFKAGLKKGIFINCWHSGLKEDMAMWRLYGKSSNAIAITSTVGRLEKQIEPHNNGERISIRKVEYIDHFEDPEIDISKYSNIFTYKHEAYSFEKEVRVIANHYPNPEVMSRDTYGFEMKIDLASLLRSIVIPPEAPEWFFDLVTRTSRDYGCDSLVKKSDLANEPI